MSEKLETLWEFKKGDLYVEVVKGLNGIYLSLNKRNMGVVLTLEEAVELEKLIQNARMYNEEGVVGAWIEGYKKWENFESESE